MTKIATKTDKDNAADLKEKDKDMDKAAMQASRNQAVGIAALAKLPGVSGAPSDHRAVVDQCQAMAGTSRDSHDRAAVEHAVGVYRNRNQAVGRGACPESAVKVKAPSEHPTVGAQCKAVGLTGGDGDDHLAGKSPGLVYHDRYTASDRAVVAQLTRAIRAPGKQAAVGGEREGVV